MLCRWILCLCFLASIAFAHDDLNPSEDNSLDKTPEPLPKPVIKFLHYDTEIENRYASTVVSSNVANPANKSQEVSFRLVLPDTAFISGFVMIIKNKEYKAYVKEKEEAKQTYDAAVAAGQSAAHIEQDVRDSNKFQVSVNVEAEGKVMFNLTYEELLTRTLGNYKNVINVNPGQIVKNLVVKLHVKEPVPITHFSVPKFRTKNEITSEKEEDEKLAVIERDTKNNPFEASVTWSPTTEDQIKIAKDGLHGQLVVEYDVSRSKSSQILLDEGYFVHFFTPSESVPALAKHVVFILDISGSMGGRKIEQLKEAMVKILSDLNEKDYFSIVLFSSDVIVWSPSKTQHLFNNIHQYNSFQSQDTEIETIIKRRDGTEILPANSENVEKAKTFVKKIYATDATNIMGGLREGIDLIKKGQDRFSKDSNNIGTPQPVIVFLTDGEPNVDVSDPNEIVKRTIELNEIKTPIYSLAFGEGADLQFLRRLSLKNHGFARNIYEASDSALQLNNFYKEISSPLLAGVDFSYLPGQVKNGTLTKHQFPVLFNGSEIVIAGKLDDGNVNGSNLAYEFIASKNSDSSIDYKGPENSIIILPHPRPLPEANKTFGHLEKLWGYLTIKQLLDKDTSSNQDDDKTKSPEKQQALELALKYSFVTPLTSLVVVKPNSSESTVEPEKASSSDRFGMPMYGPPGSSFAAGAAGFGGSPLSIISGGAPPSSSFFAHDMLSSSGFVPRSGFFPSQLNTISLKNQYPSRVFMSSIGNRRKSHHSNKPLRRQYGSILNIDGGDQTRPDSVDYGDNLEVLNAGPDLTSPASLPEDTTYTYSTIPNDPFRPTVDEGNTPTPHVRGGVKQTPLENVTWLTNYTANHDPFVIDVPNQGNFTVGYNETDTLYGDCNIPNEFNGHCRHLQYCPLNKFVNSVEEYVPYFCPITNSFAGVCCPPNL